MKKHLSIFLIFLINFSLQQCSQREKLENREFVKTLFVFIAPSNPVFIYRPSEDDMKRFRILYEQVMCEIPTYDKFKYMTVINQKKSDGSINHNFELEIDWNSARNKIKSSSGEFVKIL
ncbi:unnamed protein product [Caenorhabditis angaria]|uniref:Lipoprotein n=1 Tax=Caenorhabditis angaria TaxID=860376 RepID=A0A9P1IKQ0_9PELO|nr:unnamed protein product [Caenorhabditis angaria]